MTDLISFTFDTSKIRVLESESEPWWIAADLAELLGYRDAANLARTLDEDEKGTHIVRTPGGPQEMTIISESGLYHAIFASRRPEARTFRRWVTGTVLPQLRRTGSFAVQENPLDRLQTGLAGRSTVTTAEAASLAGIVADTAGQAAAAGLLRALGWKRAWVAPLAALEA